jgi:hypothetical protein
MQEAPTAGISPVNSAIRPILIFVGSSEPQPESRKIIIDKSEKKTGDFFMGYLLICLIKWRYL